MKKILYSCLLLLFVVACEQSFDEHNEMIPVAGMWARVDEHDAVTSYIEFKAGLYSTYSINANSVAYYIDGKIWGCSKQDFSITTSSSYSIFNGKIYFGRGEEFADKIYLSDGGKILHFGGRQYQRLTSFKSAPYRQISVIYEGQVIKEKEAVAVGFREALVELEYSIGNAEKGVKPTVKSEASWIKQIKVEENKISFSVADNSDSEYRRAQLILSYPLAKDLLLYVEQGSNAKIVVPDVNRDISHVGGLEYVPYSITYPCPGESLKAQCAQNWVNITVREDGVYCYISRNRSSTKRSAYLTLSYKGASDVVVTINQAASQSKPTVTVTPVPELTTGTEVWFNVKAIDAYRGEWVVAEVESWERYIDYGYTVEELMDLEAYSILDGLEEINSPAGWTIGWYRSPADPPLRVAVRVWNEDGVASDIAIADNQAKSN
uniref:BACON domain-containing protein n=1 Tax=Alistipes sp. TaxID=1872444 RepID=UPI00405764AD